MFGFLSSRYYDAAATLELMPAWLRFLEEHGLLMAEQRTAAQQELRRLVADAAPTWEKSISDPSVGPNIQRAWE